MPLVPRRVLQHGGLPIEHIYFIEDGLVSVFANAEERNGVEVWLIGREGVVGSPAVLGRKVTPLRYVVQIGGDAFRISVEDLTQLMADMPSLRAALLDYLHTALVQSSQSAACGLKHAFPQRLARWLLTAQDRCTRDDLPITHELLARILGVRRATVSEAVNAFEQRGLLDRLRGLVGFATATDWRNPPAAVTASQGRRAHRGTRAVKYLRCPCSGRCLSLNWSRFEKRMPGEPGHPRSGLFHDAFAHFGVLAHFRETLVCVFGRSVSVLITDWR